MTNIDTLKDPYLTPNITQILQMVIGYYDPHTDVFDKYEMDLQKATQALNLYVEGKVKDELENLRHKDMELYNNPIIKKRISELDK